MQNKKKSQKLSTTHWSVIPQRSTHTRAFSDLRQNARRMDGKCGIICFHSNNWKASLCQHHHQIHLPEVKEDWANENCISFVRGPTETSHTFISALLRIFIQSSTHCRLLGQIASSPACQQIMEIMFLAETPMVIQRSVLNFQQIYPMLFLFYCSQCKQEKLKF